MFKFGVDIGVDVQRRVVMGKADIGRLSNVPVYVDHSMSWHVFLHRGAGIGLFPGNGYSCRGKTNHRLGIVAKGPRAGHYVT